jgi:hypothetical protein
VALKRRAGLRPAPERRQMERSDWAQYRQVLEGKYQTALKPPMPVMKMPGIRKAMN